MATYDIIPHRTRSTVSVSVCDAPLAVQWQVMDAYGFGPASWEQLDPPTCSIGDGVTITCEGSTVHQGRVSEVSDPEHVAGQLRYRVSTVGLAEALKDDETIEGVFVDRDLAQWRTASSGSSAAADFSIAADVTDSITFRFADVEAGLVQVDMAEPTLAYKLSETGNSPPGSIPAWYSPAKPLWSAAVYHIGGGATAKRISSVAFGCQWEMEQTLIDALTTPDYENPEGSPDPKYGNSHATYPDLDLWTEFYGRASAPDTAFVGVYCCDYLSDLPTSDPAAMLTDPHRKFVCKHNSGTAGHASTEEEAPARPRYYVDCSFVVFYAAYLPVRHPVNISEEYDEAEDHIVRKGWVAMTRAYAEAGQWCRFYDVEICAQGYVPEKDGSDDLGKVFDILYPDNEHPAMKLPPASDTDAPRSIAIRQPCTMLAAVAELLALSHEQYSWGVYDGGTLVIQTVSGAPAFACSDEPGVDTSGCTVSSEGAVELVQVAYALPANDEADPTTLGVPYLGMLVVDAAGDYELVTPDWEPSGATKIAFCDATASANSAEAAAKIGQGIAYERRPNQGSGTIRLNAIDGASTTRPGGLASGPGVPADARVTGVSVSVDSDEVSISLGPRGYEGRFPPRVAGKPATSSPTQAQLPASALETRRLVTRK